MKTTNFVTGLLIAIFFLCNFNISIGQNSNGWRGIKRDCTVDGFKIPAKWPAQLKNTWQVKVGEADASPVMVDNKIFLLVKQEGNEVALWINALDGKEIWKSTLNPSPDIQGPAIGHPGPRSTPFIADGKIFTLGTGGILHCLDGTSGKVIWKNDAYTEVPSFYTSCSPLVFDGKCVIQLGGKDHGIAIAFDVNTGKEIWKLEGLPTTYSSPSLMKTIKNMLLVQSETDLCGVSTDGKLLWKIPCPTQRYFSNSNSPVYENQSVIVSGQGTGTKLFDIKKTGENWETKEIWANKDFGVSFNTLLFKDGFIYGHEAKNGSIFCLNAKTGEKAWADSTRHNRFATISDAGKVLISLSATGNLIVYEPNNKSYVELAKYKVAETEVYSFPILSGNKIYVKDREMLTCWSLE